MPRARPAAEALTLELVRSTAHIQSKSSDAAEQFPAKTSSVRLLKQCTSFGMRHVMRDLPITVEDCLQRGTFRGHLHGGP